MPEQDLAKEKSLADEWREVRNDLSLMFKERQLDFAKAAERYELALHEEDLDYVFNYERVKKFWKKPPKPGASPEALQKDCPEPSRLPKALEYLRAVRTYLLEKEGLVVGKKNSDAKRRLIEKIGLDNWNVVYKQVIRRVEKEEEEEGWK